MRESIVCMISDKMGESISKQFTKKVVNKERYEYMKQLDDYEKEMEFMGKAEVICIEAGDKGDSSKNTIEITEAALEFKDKMIEHLEECEGLKVRLGYKMKFTITAIVSAIKYSIKYL